MSKKKKEKTQYDIFRSERKDWGNINPVTKIIPNKKKNPRVKHKNQSFDF